MPDSPIIVNGSTLPTMIAVILRYGITVAGTYLVSRGVIDEGSLEGVVTVIITAATVAYGIWRTKQTKDHLIVAAEAAPNAVAQVK